MFNEQIKRPKVPQLKGRAKIQVFNEDGSIDNEVKTNNFIFKGAEHHMLQSTLSVLGNPLTSSHSSTMMAKKLILMYDKPRGQEGYASAGRTVGFANLQSSETPNEWRGQRNNEESFYGRNIFRYVVDFPSQSANGVFNSLLVTPGNALDGYAPFGENERYYGFGLGTPTSETTGNFRHIISGSFEKFKPFFWATFGNGVFKCDPRTLEVELITKESTRDGGSLLDGHLFDYVSGTIRKWTVEGDKVKEIKIPNHSSSYGLTTDGKVLYYSGARTASAGGGDVVIKLRSDLTIIDTIEVDAHSYMAYVDGTVRIGGGVFDEETGTVHGDAFSSETNKTTTGRTRDFQPLIAHEDFLVGWVTYDSTSRILVKVPAYHLSRINLDSEVEKRKGQTMKVTYEYEFVNPYDPLK